ncbi:MT-A70-domain-containing protein [Apiospora marii]|uniref:MT-A70-domain-containing protein n=1 Tax=Apiospora marii TaxID=335849 RepID=A0ABR1SBB0_9PEZI
MGSCILYENSDKSVLVVDIPRSIEEAQFLAGAVAAAPSGSTAAQQPGKRRLLSSKPLGKPWQAPSAKTNAEMPSWSSASPAVQLDELMVTETVRRACAEVNHAYSGPWCLPRVCRSSATTQPRGLQAETAGSTRKRDDDQEEDMADEDDNKAPSPYVPEASQYLEGSIQELRPAFLEGAPKFDLVVLDPPWPSRSVKRKKASYKITNDMQEMRDLLSLIPIAAHLKPDGLVAVWVTNKLAVIDLVKSQEGMFSLWGLEVVGEWIWVKVTDSGEPIVALESTWRKPWERLLVARRRGSSTKIGPERKVIFGVPDLHSRKPNLRQLFASILPADYVGLEVFARHITAGWWSWGDQALLFQQKHHWVEEDIVTGAAPAHEHSVDVSIKSP